MKETSTTQSPPNMVEGPSVHQEMAAIVARFATQDQEWESPIEGLYFNRRSSPTQPVHTSQWPCFALVLQGAKSLTLGDELYRYGVGDYLVVSLDLPVASRVTEASRATPHLGLGMAIDPERVRDVMGRLDPLPTTLPHADVRGVAVVTASRELLDASLRLVRLLDSPADIPVLAPLFEQEILYRLLCGPFGPRLCQIALAETPSNRVARAIAWLKRHFRRPLRIAELANEIGMSVSSLHHHFKAVTAMTPMQYQKRLRLHEARRLMLVEHVDVGTAGYVVGYRSPSQFSREYRRLYGQSPLYDVRVAARKQSGARAPASASP